MWYNLYQLFYDCFPFYKSGYTSPRSVHQVGNMERHALEGGMMRVRLTGWYRVLWGTSNWNPYPSQTMDPNSHPDHKTNQPTKQPAKQPTNQSTNQSTDRWWTDQPTVHQPINQSSDPPTHLTNRSSKQAREPHSLWVRIGDQQAISGQNIKFVPIFLLVTSDFMFRT